MAKQINVDLRVNADVTQAKKAMQDLQNTLANFSAKSGTTGKIVDSKQFEDASRAAQELRQHLKAATDVNTGKLNLSELSASLKTSGKSLAQYQKTMEAVGTEGQEAFMKVSYAIATAEAPARRVNTLFKEMGTVMKNTIRWQFSSSMLHGFMGAIQQAYGYAQDLNRSLNDIRIVTGQSEEQMAAFANRANKAAQALSASTTEYTNASLIFYQQGLSDEEVEARTNATIKMAHAAGESATEVSSYMTAIWNNFAKSGDNLEYYADVITKLGAATAASSAEIAGGLEKFAAVADTVGLSYEYAAAAVTTIVDKTRQSEDVVGTSLKTIFARIEGLQLGKTFDEDGVTTDLNKYSQALLKVGVNIKEDNGELRDMDEILYDLGEKWETLSKAQQVALAQTVGGMRQYNQFIALMDNWEAFQENVTLANESEGTLQAQADIYAESWEAASKRVKASAQGIYQEILDDKFFIKVNNVLADSLNIINGLIKGLGGVKGIMSTIASIFMANYAKEMPAVLDRVKQEIMLISGQAKKIADIESNSALKQVGEFAKNAVGTFAEQPNASNAVYAAESQSLDTLARLRYEYNQKVSTYSEKEKQDALDLIELQTILTEQVKAEAENYKSLEESVIRSKDAMIEKAEFSNQGKDVSENLTIIEYGAQVSASVKATSEEIKVLEEEFNKAKTNGEDFTQSFTEGLTNIKNNSNDLGIRNKIQELLDSEKDVETVFKKLNGFLSKTGKDAEAQIHEAADALRALKNEDGKKLFSDKEIEKIVSGFNQLGTSSANLLPKIKGLNNATGELPTHTVAASEALMTLGSSLMQVNALINSITNAFKTFNDENATTMQRVTAVIGVLTTLTMVAKNVVSSVGKVSGVIIGGGTKSIAKETAAKIANTFATKEMSKADEEAAIKKIMAAGASEEEAQKLLKEAMAKQVNKEATKAMALESAKYMGVLLAVVVALYAAFEAYKKLNSIYHQDAEAAKEAADAAEAMAQASDEARQRAEDLKSTFDEYNNVTSALEDCTKGTKEWYTALDDVNSKVLELLEKYPELSKYVSRNKNGVLEIDEEGYQEVIRQAEQASKEASYMAIYSRGAAQEAQVRSNRTDIRRKMSSDMESQTNVNDIIIQHAIRTYEQHINELAGLTQKEYAAKLKEYGVNSDLIPVMEQYRNRITDLSDETEAATTKMRKAIEMLVFDRYGDTPESGMIASQMEDEMKRAFSTWSQYSRKRTFLEYVSDIGSGSSAKIKDSRAEMEELFARHYAETTGQEITKWTKDGVYITGQETPLTYTQVYQIASEELAKGNIGVYEDRANQVLSSLNNIEDEGIQAFLKAVITGKGEDALTDEQYQSYLTQRAEVTADGTSFAEYMAENLGFDSPEQMVGVLGLDIAERMNDLSTVMAEDFISSYSNSVQDAFNNIDTEGMTRGTQVALANVIESAIAQGSFDTLSEAISGMAPEQLEKFVNNLNTIDWKNTNVAEFRQYLKDFGINVNKLTDDELQDLINTMGLMGKSTEDVTTRFAELTKILKGLSIGDTISSEDYGKLDEAQQEYFAKALDGTYMLIGAAEDLQDTITENARREITALSIEEINKSREDLTQAETNLENARIPTNVSNVLMTPEEAYDAWQNALEAESNYYDSAVQSGAGLSVEMINRYSDAVRDWYKTYKYIEENYENAVLNAELNYEEAVQEYNNSIDEYESARQQREQSLLEYRENLTARGLSFDNLEDLTTDYRSGAWTEGIAEDDAEAMQAAAQAYVTSYEALREIEREKGLDSAEIHEYAEYLEDTIPALEGNSEAARDLAVHNMQMAQGIETLSKNWEDWQTALKGDSNSFEYAQALNDTREAISDVLDISEQYIKDDTIIDHFDLIARAAKGDVKAIEELRAIAQEDIYIDISMNDEFLSGDQDFESWKTQFEELFSDISGPVINDADFLDSLNSLINEAGLSAEQINAILGSMGYEPTLTVSYQKMSEFIPETITHHRIVKNEDGSFDEYTSVEDGDLVEVERQVPVYALGENGETPQVTSLVATGSTSGGAVKPKTSGKSGGGSKSKTPKTGDTDKERYYTITRQIKDQEDALNRLGKAKDRAWGKAKIDLIDQESKALERELELQREYIKEIEDYYKQDQAALNGLGGQYDENGVLTNYDEIMAREIASYNDLIAKGRDEEAEARWKYVQDTIKQYDETNQLWQEQVEKARDLQNQILDKKLEKIEQKLELKVKLVDLDLSILDYQLKRLEDKTFSTAKKIENRFAQMGANIEKQSATENAIEEILANHGLSIDSLETLTPDQIANLDMTDAEMTDIISHRGELLDIQEIIDDLEDSILSGPLEAMREWEDEYNRLNDAIEDNKKVISSYVDIVTLLKGKMDGFDDEAVINLMNQNLVMSQQQVSNAKAYYESQKETLINLQAQYLAGGFDEEQREKLKKDIDEAQKLVNGAYQDLLDQTEKAIEEARKIRDEQYRINEEAVMAALGIDEWGDTLFDLETQVDDAYLDDYQKIYELSKLTRDTNKSLNNASSIPDAERYAELLEKINSYKEEGVEMSQYEVDALRAELELLQAQAMLEDAQNAKSTVRMHRDSEGNYGYVYSAGDTGDAIQSYEDKLYAYQKLNSEYVKKTEKELRDLEKRAIKAYNAIYNDDNLTEEEQQAKIAELEERYAKLMGISTEQLDIALRNNDELYHDYWTNYSAMTGYQLSEEERFQTELANTITGKLAPTIRTAQELLDNYSQAVAGEDGYLPRMQNAWEVCTQAEQDTMEMAGLSSESIGEGAEEAANRTEDASKEIRKSAEDVVTSFQSIIDKLSELTGKGLSELRDGITKTIEKLDDWIKKYTELSAAAANSSKLPGTPGSTDWGGYQGSGDEKDKGGYVPPPNTDTKNPYAQPTEEEYKKLAEWIRDRNNSLATPREVKDLISEIEKKYKIDISSSKLGPEDIYKAIKSTSKPQYVYYLFKDKFPGAKFDTGGYTGAWNSASGKLAVLHEKELVLNKQDTANMLQMLEIARDVIARVPSFGMPNSSFNNTISNGDFKQIVNINADFSGVRNSYEIEEAFNSLVNQALQYSNRKIK